MKQIKLLFWIIVILLTLPMAFADTLIANATKQICTGFNTSIINMSTGANPTVFTDDQENCGWLFAANTRGHTNASTFKFPTNGTTTYCDITMAFPDTGNGRIMGFKNSTQPFSDIELGTNALVIASEGNCQGSPAGNKCLKEESATLSRQLLPSVDKTQIRYNISMNLTNMTWFTQGHMNLSYPRVDGTAPEGFFVQEIYFGEPGDGTQRLNLSKLECYNKIDAIAPASTTCDCPTSGDWIIEDGSQCNLTTSCDIPSSNIYISKSSSLTIYDGVELTCNNIQGEFANSFLQVHNGAILNLNRSLT